MTEESTERMTGRARCFFMQTPLTRQNVVFRYGENIKSSGTGLHDEASRRSLYSKGPSSFAGLRDVFEGNVKERCSPMSSKRRQTGSVRSMKSRVRSSLCGKSKKRSYVSKVDAMMALASIQHRDNQRRKKSECRVYFCRSCKGWHLTSAPLRTSSKQRGSETTPEKSSSAPRTQFA